MTVYYQKPNHSYMFRLALSRLETVHKICTEYIRHKIQAFMFSFSCAVEEIAIMYQLVLYAGQCLTKLMETPQFPHLFSY